MGRDRTPQPTGPFASDLVCPIGVGAGRTRCIDRLNRPTITKGMQGMGKDRPGCARRARAARPWHLPARAADDPRPRSRTNPPHPLHHFCHPSNHLQRSRTGAATSNSTAPRARYQKLGRAPRADHVTKADSRKSRPLRMEARGFEPRSETRSKAASTCVAHRLRSPAAGQWAAHCRTSLLKFRAPPEDATSR